MKGMKGRIVPVRPELFDRYAADMETEYGTRWTATSCSPTSSARLQKRTGITHFSPHVCRHTYATRLPRAEAPTSPENGRAPTARSGGSAPCRRGRPAP